MLRWFISVILSFCAVAQTSPATTKPASGNENSRQAQALIAKAIEALGGQAYLISQSRREQGRTYSFHHGRSSGTGFPYVAVARYPDKDRIELVSKQTYYFVGGIIPLKDKLDFVILHVGDKGYEITPDQTTAEEPKNTAEFIRRREHSLDALLRRWINEPGVVFFYDGTAVVDGKSAQSVTVMNAQNDAITLSLDQFTNLPLKTSYSWRDPTDKLRNNEAVVYDNYKRVQGIMTPHSLTRFYNGDMALQRFLTTVVYNQDVTDALFEVKGPVRPAKP
jgi:hypothetical protein